MPNGLTLRLYLVDKRTNSTERIELDEELNPPVHKYTNVFLKAKTDLDLPTFELDDSYYNANYIYIEEFQTFYFIRKYSLGNRQIYEIECELDPLATYKDDILAQTLYVLYSSSNYNRWLRDDRVPIIPDVVSDFASAQIREHQSGENVFTTVSNNQIVILTAINQTNGLTHYVMHEDDLIKVMNAISSAGKSVWDALTAQFGAAIQSIVQVIRLPLRDEVIPTTQTLLLELGDYIVVPDDPSLPAYEFPILSSTYIQADVSVGIPAGYLDFRLAEPYQQIKVALPFVGNIDANLADYREDGDITFRVAIDLLTGAICYENDIKASPNKPLASYSGQCGTLIPFVASQIQNASGIVQSVAGGLTALGLSAATANPVPAMVGGVASIIGGFYASNQKATSVLGSFSGNRSDVLITAVKCTLIKYKTAIEPDNLTELEGRPLCKVVPLAGLTGYVKTVNAKVKIAATEDRIKRIESLLDSGIYIE